MENENFGLILFSEFQNFGEANASPASPVPRPLVKYILNDLANENGVCDGICGEKITLCNTECVANFTYFDPIDTNDGAQCQQDCLDNIGNPQQCIKKCQADLAAENIAFSMEPNIFVIISLRVLYYTMG